MSFENEVEFCLNFLTLQNSFNESSIFSPKSLLNSLATVYVGSDGNTAAEILNVIGKNNNNAEAIVKYCSDSVKRHNDIINIYKKDEETEPVDLKRLKLEEDGKTSSLVTKNIHSDLISKSISANLILPLPLELNIASDERKRGIRGPRPRKIVIKDDGRPGFEFFATNKLFLDKHIPLAENYNEMIKEKFDSRIHKFDFKDNKDDLVKLINKSIRHATKRKFGGIIKSDDDIKVNDDTSIILISATYFKGKWAYPFTFRRRRIFHSKIPRQIDFLSEKLCKIPYNIGENWKSVGIPYREHRQWMFIVMPNDKDGLENLIKQMDYVMFKECTTTSTNRCVRVTIPAFEIISENNYLAKNLQGLGIIDLFDLTRCNLSKMINNNLSHQQNINYCHLDKVIHKASIKVNEYGTGAAAVTKYPWVAGCRGTSFKVDHPFLYFIVCAKKSSNTGKNSSSYIGEEEPNEILFAGTYC